LPPPQRVGRYAIYGEIASGGMASVHFARLEEATGESRVVAVKRAHPHLAREMDFALMFLDEARLASRVRHPNVVGTVDVLETKTDLMLAMEYVHGESLWRLLKVVRERGERVPAAVASALVIDTLHGLHAAHEATDEKGQPLGLVHRDVSPQNMLVGVDGVTRLVDFGIAKAAGRLHSTRDSAVKGKYAYMAPEQVRGERVSRLTDTYAAAIVLWELVTGERLFVGKTEAETIHKSLVSRVQPPSLFAPELGKKLDTVLLRALSREPARRYATAQELAVDVEACIPRASPEEVGAWVQRIASESLDERAAVVAEIEREDPKSATSAARRTRRNAVVVIALGVVAMGASVVTLVGRRHAAAAIVAEPVVTDVATTTATATASATPTPTTPPSATASTPVLTPARPHPSRPRAKRTSCDPPYSIDSQGRQIFKPECM